MLLLNTFCCDVWPTSCPFPYSIYILFTNILMPYRSPATQPILNHLSKKRNKHCVRVVSTHTYLHKYICIYKYMLKRLQHTYNGLDDGCWDIKSQKSHRQRLERSGRVTTTKTTTHIVFFFIHIFFYTPVTVTFINANLFSIIFLHI